MEIKKYSRCVILLLFQHNCSGDNRFSFTTTLSRWGRGCILKYLAIKFILGGKLGLNKNKTWKKKKKNTKRNTSKQLGTEKKIIIKHRRHIKPTLFPATFPIIGFPLIAKRLSCMQNLSRNFLSPRKKIPIFPIQHMSNIHPTRCWMKSWNRFLSHMLDCARNLNQFNIYVNSIALKLCHPHLRHLRLTH